MVVWSSLAPLSIAIRLLLRISLAFIIDCDNKNGIKYYIGNEYVLQENSVQNWMLSTLSVSNLLGESMSLNERILLENVPSGGEKLKMVIKAMKESKKIRLHIVAMVGMLRGHLILNHIA